ncbi:hypothetical protein LCGC14_2930830, partial [marine sediment metagenome]
AIYDSIAWLSDTVFQHNLRLLTLEAGGGGGYWDRNGTDLSPTTAGDDILLDVGTGRLSYGNGNGYIYAPLNTSLIIGADGGNVITVDGAESIIASNWRPNLNSVWRLGNESRFWEATFTDSIYIDNTSNFISEDGSNNMSFTDAVTGTKTLAELASGSSYWTQNGTDLYYTTGKVGIGTNSPNAPLEVEGLYPGTVGGFPSGLLHVTTSDNSEFSNSVITGFQRFGK